MILYLDSNPPIYSIAAKARFREPTLRWLDWHAAQPDSTIVTSQLTVLESLVGILKRIDAVLRAELQRVLEAMMVVDVGEGSPSGRLPFGRHRSTEPPTPSTSQPHSPAEPISS